MTKTVKDKIEHYFKFGDKMKAKDAGVGKVKESGEFRSAVEYVFCGV